ncbi:MAG: protocatechuate 3,4-dioxygenase subunit beta [Pseudomonadota bacterium]
MTRSAAKPQGAYLPRAAADHPKALHPDYKTSVYRSPQQAPIRFPATLSEESGPMFGHDLLGARDADLLQNFGPQDQTAIGPRIIVHGRVRDQFDRPVKAALLEIWQANAGGRYRHKNEGYIAPLDPNFGGCGRVITDEDGHYCFRTVMPGAYPWPNSPNAWRPAHIHFSLFGSGFVQRLITQMYFQGDPLIWQCPIVGAIPDADAVTRLIAPLDMARTLPMDALAYRFDITLRGRRQTPFENAAEGM